MRRGRTGTALAAAALMAAVGAGATAAGAATSAGAASGAPTGRTATTLVTRDVGRWKDRTGGLTYFGEVVNTGTAPVANVGVVVTLSDAKGKPLSADATLRVSRNVLRPRETAFFVVRLRRQPPSWHAVTVTAFQGPGPTRATEQQDYRSLRTTGKMRIERGGSFSNAIDVSVRNSGTKTANVGAVMAGIYDARGHLVRVADQGSLYPWPAAQTIRAGKTAPVRIELLGWKKPVAKVVVHYRASTRANGRYLP